MNQYFIYIMASKPNGTIYIGMTNDIVRRVYEHKNHLTKGFTDDYDVTNLVYFEHCESVETAIVREKQLKEWRRKWKLELIEKANPDWRDLYNEISQ